MSNSKDYYKMRYGQAGFDPTEIEPQSIFDGRAMDFGASIASTAASRKKIIEENDKGVKQKETIVGQDGSTTETSVFKPHLKAETDGGFDVKAGLPMPISDGGIAAILENESAIDRKNDVQNRMDLLSIGMMPGEEYNIPATGSNIDMPNREQLAENIFVEDFTKQLDASKEIATGVNVDDVTTINNNVSGQAMAQEFQNDLAQANGDPAKIEAAKSEFESGLFDLSQYDPQLAKSLFAMMGAMLMGESFGDAMATGFGVMEEAAQEEEAANKAAADEVVAMLIDNAEYLNDDVFFATLAQYNLSNEQLKDITMKYGIAKSAAQNKKTATDLATAIADLDKFEKDVVALYTDSDNVGAVAPKVRQLLTYVHDQLNNQANPTWILDPKNRENRDALEEAIGTYAKRYDQYTAMGEDGIGLLKTLEAGGMEAIWEGQRGTVGMVDGKPAMGKVLVPESQEPLMMAITSIANIKMKDEKKRNQYLAEKHDYWKKNVEGKKGMAYNQDYDSVIATGYLSKPEEYGYLGWLYHQLQADTM